MPAPDNRPATMIGAMIDELIAREGGYVDHPADRGGPTNWGITHMVARAHGYTGKMQAMPRAFAYDVYRKCYWTDPGFEEVADIAPLVAVELFDTGVNMGPEVATKFLQRALNALNRGGRDYPDISVDQIIGEQTIAALRSFLKVRTAGDRVLCKALNALQGERYLALAEGRPANEAFLYGWIANRIG